LAGLTVRITGNAPTVRGRPAFWAAPVPPPGLPAGSPHSLSTPTFLVWQYARNGWAQLTLTLLWRGSPRQPVYRLPVYRRDAVKIADHIRYGAATPPLLFPVQLTHLPSRWRVSSLTYQADAGVLRVGTYARGAGPPNLGADGSLEYQTNLPYFIIGPATRRTNPCYAEPHQSIREIINGYRVVLTTRSPSTRSTSLDLCAAHADGLTLFISEPGAHPPITPASLFRNHLRLLGANPANWTRKPIG
jgi:hypothetical protein